MAGAGKDIETQVLATVVCSQLLHMDFRLDDSKMTTQTARPRGTQPAWRFSATEATRIKP